MLGGEYTAAPPSNLRSHIPVLIRLRARLTDDSNLLGRRHHFETEATLYVLTVFDRT